METKKRVGVGLGVMLVKGSKVLLGKRHEDPTKADSELHGEGTWTMPGGGIEFGEDFEDCAYREVLEETGIIINKEELKLISVSNDKVADAHFVTLGFLCEDFFGEAQVREPDEITEWQWFDLESLPEPIFLCSAVLLERYRYQVVYK